MASFTFDDLAKFEKEQKAGTIHGISSTQGTTASSVGTAIKTMQEKTLAGPNDTTASFNVTELVLSLSEVFKQGAQEQARAISDANTQLFKEFPFMLETAIAKEKNQLLEKLALVDETVNELQQKIDDARSLRPIEVVINQQRSVVEGFTHRQLEALLKALSTSFPIMLVGSAGSGKTYAAKQCSDALKLNFYAMSVGSQTSQSNLVGYMSANGTYVSTEFREAYETGGVFVLDEVDAGNPNVLIVLNSALSSGFCPFPDKMVKKHENFRLIATANTYGTGASRKYVGRNQLDAATLDRFITIDWSVDEGLERQLVSNYPDGLRWQSVIKAIRDKVNEHGYEVVVSPRATLKGAQLLTAGYTFEEALTASLLASVPESHAQRLQEVAEQTWRNQRV